MARNSKTITFAKTEIEMEKINNLVPKLGELKLLNDPDINFDSITKDYILDFSTNLPEIECFIPILGLTVDTELDI